MEPDPADGLYTVKLLAALRSGDQGQLQRFLNVIAKHDPTSPLSTAAATSKAGLGSQSSVFSSSPTTGERDLGAEALNLAVRCATVPTIQFLLSHRSISSNSVFGEKRQTPLHLAASLSRPSVISLLLSLPLIDDTIKDSDGNTCRDIAIEVTRKGGPTTSKARECLKILDESRHALSATYQSLLHSYILTPVSSSHSSSSSPTTPLLSLLQSPRISHINLNYLDEDTGQSILHAAAQRKDISMLEAAVKAGASVLTRNRQSQLPIDLCPPPSSKKIGEVDGGVRGFLKAALARQQGGDAKTSITTPMGVGDASDVPGLKGKFLPRYLNKYTNMARGYNVRWFVLKGGVLSYYKTPLEESVSSRGSISMRSAVLKKGGSTGSGDSMRFEVMSFGGGSHPTQRWFLKASHQNEAERWIKELERSIEWSRRTVGAQTMMGGSLSLSMNRSGSIGSTLGISTDKEGTDRDSLSGLDISAIDDRSTTSVDKARVPGVKYSDTYKSLKGALHKASDSQVVSGIDESLYVSIGGAAISREETDSALVGNHLDSLNSASDSDEEALKDAIPSLEDELDLLGNAILATMSTLRGKQVPSVEFLGDTFRDMELYIRSTANLRGKLKAELQRQKDRSKAWEEAVQSVVNESSQLEKELAERARNHTHHHRNSKKRRSTSLFLAPTANEEGQRTIKAIKEDEKSEERLSVKQMASIVTLDESVFHGEVLSITAEGGTPEAEEEMDTSEEDEFFDAIESNNLPNLVVPPNLEGVPLPTAAQTPSVSSPVAIANPLNQSTYAAYHHLRNKLELEPGNMPSTSLWSVLKNSIGKDLTRISFPVHFNEPTSMLQRMAEDMEFSGCLDTAARSPDPHIRIAYVAAFGMSNYSSTIGRIAKPFNPMLSETFEYVRQDKEYRYMSEQVSHHPPISACWAESPRWHYYGEVDAQNKFMGKSFEIRPTGVAHAELIIPADFAPSHLRDHYPSGNSSLFHRHEDLVEGKVNEHYSWKKVTTNISGFIMGSPTIDHYGDMVVTNHRTGDQCVLTFKPRGWRGKDAYEISGVVRDSNGSIVYEIAGRWNSQLIARKVGAGDGTALNPDHAIASPGIASPTIAPLKEYILLWRNSEKIQGSPFNLTPFALTLNDCPLTLKPYLCPTDCRLRPDQRAFELGMWDKANELKMMQEDKQRATRRAREEGKLPRHTPRWFVAITDGDTGERVWNPSRVGDNKNGLEYWHEREQTWNARMAGSDTVRWKGVDHIFIGEPSWLSSLTEPGLAKGRLLRDDEKSIVSES